MNTNIDCTIAIDNEIDLTIDVVIKPLTKQAFKSYASKIRLQSAIHRDLIDKMNAQREARLQAFFRPDDQYVPESMETCNLLKLMMDHSMSHAKVV